MNFFALNFFFGKKLFENLSKLNFNFRPNRALRIFSHYKFLTNVDFIVSYLFGNFTFALFNKQFNYLKLVFFKLINLSLNRFITHNYYNYSVTRNWPLSGLNFKSIRNFKTTVSASLLGFKMSCLGRFSRRQRVRKVYFLDFKLPLTQISANIDYSFSVIPLENSAVSVKI